jgi:hypothetical protein
VDSYPEESSALLRFSFLSFPTADPWREFEIPQKAALGTSTRDGIAD